MPDYKKIAIYSGAVGLVTPLVVKLLAKLPTVQVTLSTIEVNVRENVGVLAGQGSTIGTTIADYVLSLLGSPAASGVLIGYLYTIIGMIVLGLGGFWLAEQLGWAKSKLQRAVVPLALASAVGGLIVLPILGGAAIGEVLSVMGLGSFVVAINLALGASVVTGLNYLVGDPLNLIP